MDVVPSITQDRQDTPDPLSSSVLDDIDFAPATPRHRPQSANPHERWSKLPKSRGRQPRDPQGQVVKFSCRDVDDMEDALRGYIRGPTGPAEHTTIEFIFPMSSAFMVYAADFKNVAKSNVESEKQYSKFDRTAISVIDALAPSQDAKDRMRRQKAIAKVCVEACEQADGFRYSFHNNWLSREDGACRFSYFCNDSTLNKGRAANEGAGMTGKKMRKPVFDCQGLIAIKFSSTKQNLEVHYKHVPLHKTYAERAPPPRAEQKRGLDLDTPNVERMPVNKRKRKVTPVEASIPAKSHRRRATEPAANNTTIEAIDLTREDSLQPLVEFLGSANALDHNVAPSFAGRDSIVQQQASSLSAAPKASTETTVVGGRPLLPKKPTIPGAMVGSVRRGYLNWTAKASTDSNNEDSRDTQNTPAKPSGLLSGITEAASAGTADAASIALSELLALKKKLEEAEERIKKLESEKTNVIPPSHMSPQPSLWPPPPGYGHPQQQPYLYLPQTQSYPQQIQQEQMRFHPPTHQSFPPASDGPRASTSSPALDPTAESAQPPSERPTSKPTKKPAQKPTKKPGPKVTQQRPFGRKFVLYTPKAKKPPDRPRQSSTATSTRASSAVNGD